MFDLPPNPESLLPIADEYRQIFSAAQPFSHVVIDGLFAQPLLDSLLTEFPQANEDVDWQRFKQGTSVKLALRQDWQMGIVTRQLLNQLNSSAFLQFLERVTGIDGLVPDPHYFGGGLHQIESGGFLKIHSDFNFHEKLLLHRRLNVLIYLNRDWNEEWGGHLELWDTSMKKCVHRIAPIFNRTVIFATTDWSYHGHPDPLACPPGTTRKSLATYYYTAGRPPGEMSLAHNTLYQRRPGERFLRDWIPPVLIDAARRLRRGR